MVAFTHYHKLLNLPHVEQRCDCCQTKVFQVNSFSVRQNQTSHYCCLIKRPNSPDKRPWRHETPDVTSCLSSPDDPSWPFANALRDQRACLSPTQATRPPRALMWKSARCVREIRSKPPKLKSSALRAPPPTSDCGWVPSSGNGCECRFSYLNLCRWNPHCGSLPGGSRS